MLRAGYRPGMLIARLRRDFFDLQYAAIDDTSGEFTVATAALSFQVREEVEPGILMKIVAAEFVMPVASEFGGPADIVVRHSGRWRRTGVDFKLVGQASDDAKRLRDRLAADAQLKAALLPLDFTRCRLAQAGPHWELRLRHFGGCEVMGVVPRFSRYVRLVKAQREALLASFAHFRRALTSDLT